MSKSKYCISPAWGNPFVKEKIKMAEKKNEVAVALNEKSHVKNIQE